ncbi:monovalent cation/H(+) antiporter subunit G [Noviherbaspirillum sp. Root189]|uniref:monovalent cation/H(+) antiporter subunit G n=1 Tax=Noviherbaspirillum sp. Root189 TaxID=1736487 RepID=UPI00070C1B44|nr:monovalent cation/H(+) antiporter subunit G [Noviherbaspirillum sp. Root189]KRB84011.1 cation:proton antiporter [Noviherbaspirillum sp. Root189]
MNAIEDISWWAVLPVAALLILGGSIILIGALGLMRLPNFYQRIHGPAITITLGAGCVLMASIIYFSALEARLVVHELIITVFVFMTAPVVAMMIMRAAVYRDLRAGKQDTGVRAGGVYQFGRKE